MILYKEADSITSSSPIERATLSPTTSPEITEKLQKLGILLSPEILDRIQKADQGENLKQDISAVEANPSEKNKFEQLYLNGYGQTVNTPFGNLSFAEIQVHEKKDEILDDIMTPEQANAYDNWVAGKIQMANQNNQAKLEVEKAANQEGKIIDTRIQAANQNNQAKLEVEKAANQQAEKLVALNAKLAEPIGQIEGINGVPKPDINDLRKQAEANPPKELQGIDPVDIKSSKYDNILIANYYIRDASNISKNLNPADQERFMKSITSMSNIIEGREDFGKLTKRIVLNSNREKVEQLGNKIINSGYSKDVIWNPRDRSITFRNAQGDTLVIDTAKVPPIERVVYRGLSMGREVSGISPREKEKNILEKRQSELQSSVIIDNKNVTLTPLNAIPKELSEKNPTEIGEHAQAQLDFVNAKNPTEKLIAIERLKTTNANLNTARKNTLNIDNLGSTKDYAPMEKELADERISILKLEGSINQFLNTTKQLIPYKDLNNTDSDSFYIDAKKTLGYASTIAYDELGQDVFEKMIDAINLQNRGSIAEIDLSKNPKLDEAQEKELVRAIARLSRKSDIMTAWQGVDPNDEIIAYRQMQSPSGRISLQNLKKSTSFQSMIGNNIDVFSRYLYDTPENVSRQQK